MTELQHFSGALIFSGAFIITGPLYFDELLNIFTEIIFHIDFHLTITAAVPVPSLIQ